MQRGLAIYDVLSAARDVGCGSVASTASPGSARGASRSSSPTSRLAISALEAPLGFGHRSRWPLGVVAAGWCATPWAWARWSPRGCAHRCRRNLVAAGGQRLDAARGSHEQFGLSKSWSFGPASTGGPCRFVPATPDHHPDTTWPVSPWKAEKSLCWPSACNSSARRCHDRPVSAFPAGGPRRPVHPGALPVSTPTPQAGPQPGALPGCP